MGDGFEQRVSNRAVASARDTSLYRVAIDRQVERTRSIVSTKRTSPSFQGAGWPAS
jgi:hypothetical protein